MKLDPRIEIPSYIFTPFSDNEMALEGKVKGYFADDIIAFSDLQRCKYGTLAEYDFDLEYPYLRKDGLRYAFFIPESFLLKPKEKEYVPFETTHDLAKVNFHVSSFVNFINKEYPEVIHRALITEVNYKEVEEELIDITLGSTTYSFDTLCDKYMYLNTNMKWVPFGKRIEE